MQRQGLNSDRILIQIPGVDDPERVKDLVAKPAFLEFKKLIVPPSAVGGRFGGAESRDQLVAMFGGQLPPDVEAYEGDPNSFGGRLSWWPLSLSSPVSGNDLLNARLTTRDNPTLNNPTTLAQVLDALQVQISAKRTNLVLRLPTGDSGVALEGRALPNLPPSMVHILANGRRTGAQTLRQTLVARKATDWVIQGSETVRFTVSKLPRYEGRAEQK